jgi:hypothetical protein
MASQPFEATQEDDSTIGSYLNVRFEEVLSEAVSDDLISIIPNPFARLVLRSTIEEIDDQFLGIKYNGEMDPEMLYVHVVGRGSKCDIKLNKSVRVSNNHCKIFVKPNFASPADPTIFKCNQNEALVHHDIWIVDTSANGTFVNGTRLVKNLPRQLHEGDKICLINPEISSAVDSQNHTFSILSFLPNSQQCVEFNYNENVTVNEFGEINDWSDDNMSIVDDAPSPIIRTNTIMRMVNKGRNINHFYEIGEKLGMGMAGAVYKCTSKSTGQRFAVKVLDSRATVWGLDFTSPDAEAMVKDLLKEAELLRVLRHPNIIHLEDIFADKKYIYLVMELSEGNYSSTQ